MTLRSSNKRKVYKVLIASNSKMKAWLKKAAIGTALIGALLGGTACGSVVQSVELDSINRIEKISIETPRGSRWYTSEKNAPSEKPSRIKALGCKTCEGSKYNGPEISEDTPEGMEFYETYAKMVGEFVEDQIKNAEDSFAKRSKTESPENREVQRNPGYTEMVTRSCDKKTSEDVGFIKMDSTEYTLLSCPNTFQLTVEEVRYARNMDYTLREKGRNTILNLSRINKESPLGERLETMWGSGTTTSRRNQATRELQYLD
jgi:hypothetical protein